MNPELTMTMTGKLPHLLLNSEKNILSILSRDPKSELQYCIGHAWIMTPLMFHHAFSTKLNRTKPHLFKKHQVMTSSVNRPAKTAVHNSQGFLRMTKRRFDKLLQCVWSKWCRNLNPRQNWKEVQGPKSIIGVIYICTLFFFTWRNVPTLHPNVQIVLFDARNLSPQNNKENEKLSEIQLTESRKVINWHQFHLYMHCANASYSKGLLIIRVKGPADHQH